jgi:hypothetical protein
MNDELTSLKGNEKKSERKSKLAALLTPRRQTQFQSKKRLASAGRRKQAASHTHAPLLVFERDVEDEQVAVLVAARHVRVTGAVVKNKAVNELRVHRRLVLHVHDLDLQPAG